MPLDPAPDSPLETAEQELQTLLVTQAHAALERMVGLLQTEPRAAVRVLRLVADYAQVQGAFLGELDLGPDSPRGDDDDLDEDVAGHMGAMLRRRQRLRRRHQAALAGPPAPMRDVVEAFLPVGLQQAQQLQSLLGALATAEALPPEDRDRWAPFIRAQLEALQGPGVTLGEGPHATEYGEEG